MTGPGLGFGNLRLVSPDVERDAALGVQWINGPDGAATMVAMGNAPGDIKPTTLEAEHTRVQGFLDDADICYWMIEADGRVVGAIWLALTPTEYLEAPSVHMMIGDSAARGHGIGRSALVMVLAWAREHVSPAIVSRALTTNAASAHMLTAVGFKLDGAIYRDHDDLEWQNYKL